MNRTLPGGTPALVVQAGCCGVCRHGVVGRREVPGSRDGGVGRGTLERLTRMLVPSGGSARRKEENKTDEAGEFGCRNPGWLTPRLNWPRIRRTLPPLIDCAHHATVEASWRAGTELRLR